MLSEFLAVTCNECKTRDLAPAGRGLYQLAGADISPAHSLAEAARAVPHGCQRFNFTSWQPRHVIRSRSWLAGRSGLQRSRQFRSGSSALPENHWRPAWSITRLNRFQCRSQYQPRQLGRERGHPVSMTPQSHRRPTSAVEELEAAALNSLVSVLGSEARSMSGPSSMIPRRSRVLARSSVSMARGHYAWSAAMCGRKMNLPSPNPSLKATLFASISRQESDVSRDERARTSIPGLGTALTLSATQCANSAW